MNFSNKKGDRYTGSTPRLIAAPRMNLNTKIIFGLERISDAYRTLLWEKAKVYGLSPIQIQVLLFLGDHQPQWRNVSHLAMEFNVTKPTISDAVKVLIQKGHLVKEASDEDKRKFILNVSASGQSLIAEIADFSLPLERALNQTGEDEKKQLFTALTHLIYKLNRAGIIQVQRTCLGCRFHEQRNGGHYCNLLKKGLKSEELRLDCEEFEQAE